MILFLPFRNKLNTLTFLGVSFLVTKGESKALVSESGAGCSSVLSGSGVVSFCEGADIGRLNRDEFGERPKEVKETAVAAQIQADCKCKVHAEIPATDDSRKPGHPSSSPNALPTAHPFIATATSSRAPGLSLILTPEVAPSEGAVLFACSGHTFPLAMLTSDAITQSP